ncbi:MAG: DUF5723 family protein [Candidatus Neomarinimicrobiota bacterium]
MMRKLAFYGFTGLLLLSAVTSQVKRDPRAVALAGAYSTIADGIFTVGYNPALLAYQVDKPFMLQLAGFDIGIMGNYFSLAALNSLSGDTLNQSDKDALLNRLDNAGGLKFFSDYHMAFPGLNYASGNMALTSNMLIMADYKFPADLIRLILEGNADNPVLDLTFQYEIMGVNEFGFSFAVPYQKLAFGLTLKYLQGMFYLGVDQDSSSSEFVTTPTSVYGSGTYQLRQGIGGTGIALDIGISSQEINGWRFGFSIINALGSISWNKPSMIKDILAGPDNQYGNGDDLFHFTWGGETLNDSNKVVYTFIIDSLRADNLSSGAPFRSSSKVVNNLDKNGKPKQFKTNYPAILRFGTSLRKNDLLLSSDLITGFEDRLFARAGWKWSIGAELTRFEGMPLRIGFAWAGLDNTELGMGFGIHKGPMIFDVGFAFRNGIWFQTMKGFNLSLGFTITSFKSRKEKLPGGPAPELETGTEQILKEEVESPAQE